MCLSGKAYTGETTEVYVSCCLRLISCECSFNRKCQGNLLLERPGTVRYVFGGQLLEGQGLPQKESGCDPDSSSTPPKVERFELRPLLNNPDKNNSPHLRTAPIPIPLPQAGPAGRAHLKCALMLSQPHVGLLPCTHVQPVLAQPSKGKRLMQLFQRFST